MLAADRDRRQVFRQPGPAGRYDRTRAALGRRPTFDETRRGWPTPSRVHGVSYVGRLTDAETAMGRRSRANKYGSAGGRARSCRRRGPARGRAVTDAPREYPDAPRVGVGAVVLEGDRVLLVQRGRPPSQGKWSLPGGLVHLGERLEDAVRREVTEECGLAVRVLDVCGVIDRVVRDGGAGDADRVRYHWVIVDYVAEPAGGTLRAASDAADALGAVTARWLHFPDRLADSSPRMAMERDVPDECVPGSDAPPTAAPTYS
jgi:ADP-ribose pyrophosphatase YjhB (NUDIX family)